MTCREKLQLEHPEYANVDTFGGCWGCPHSFEYLDRPDDCNMVGNKDICTACWDREIPGTEEIKKEKDIMPVNAIHTREVTKEDLLKEIKLANEHIHQMENQIKNLERYKQYENMADEMKAMHTAFMNSGFTNEQAFEMIKMLTQAVVPTALRGMGL